MDSSIVDKVIRMAIGQYKEIHFIWHGGEPLMRPLSFYKDVNEIERKYKDEIIVSHAMQTNGTLITREVMEVIGGKYKLGISFDGIDNEANRGQSEKTLEGIAIAKEYQESIGAIKVLTSCNKDALLKDYWLFNERGIHLKISPLFNCGKITDAHLFYNEKEYADAMGALFEYWISDVDSQIIVEPFEGMLKMLFGSPHRPCNCGSCLGCFLCINPEGNIYPCSRYYPDEYLIGNIRNFDSINHCFDSDIYGEMVRGAIERRENCRENCSLFGYCQGGCNNEAIMAGDITKSNTSSCRYFKALFPLIMDKGGNINEIKNNALVKRIRKECFVRNE